MSNKIAAVILGAGKGTRMKSDLPKVMMPVCGKPMIKHITDTLEGMNVDKIVTVIAPDGDLVKQTVAPHQTCVQDKQLGTGHAVKCAADLLNGFDNTTSLQVTIMNSQINKEQFSEKLLLKSSNDGLDPERQEINEILHDKIMNGQNGLHCRKYFTITTAAANLDAANTIFFNMEAHLIGCLARSSKL